MGIGSHSNIALLRILVARRGCQLADWEDDDDDDVEDPSINGSTWVPMIMAESHLCCRLPGPHLQLTPS